MPFGLSLESNLIDKASAPLETHCCAYSIKSLNMIGTELVDKSHIIPCLPFFIKLI